MHRSHNEPKKVSGAETAGATLHHSSQYDILSNLLGLGVNRPNSRMVIELAQVKPGDKVLDVACGTGNLTLTAKSYAGPDGEVHGIDAAPEMIEAAKKKASRSGLDVVFEIGLIEKLAFPESTFDVVISRLAIHHLPDDLKRRGFAEILRVLKPYGHVLIADFRRPSNHFLNHLTSAFVSSHMLQTDVWGLPAMLTSAGFADVTCGPTRSPLMAFVSGKKPRK